MPNNVVMTKRQEDLWEKAKSQAEKQGQKENYAYIMGIYKNMGGLNKTAAVDILNRINPSQSQLMSRIANKLKNIATMRDYLRSAREYSLFKGGKRSALQAAGLTESADAVALRQHRDTADALISENARDLANLNRYRGSTSELEERVRNNILQLTRDPAPVLRGRASEFEMKKRTQNVIDELKTMRDEAQRKVEARRDELKRVRNNEAGAVLGLYGAPIAGIGYGIKKLKDRKSEQT